MVLPFEEEYRKKYYKLLDEVFDSNFWSDGKMTRMFEEKFEEYTGLPSCAVTSGGAGLLSIFEYIGVRGYDVIVPANTFWATTQAAKMAGANIIYADCNKEDLCLSYEDLIRKVTPNTRAIVVVHIGGHIAFDIDKIAKFCNEKKTSDYSRHIQAISHDHFHHRLDKYTFVELHHQLSFFWKIPDSQFRNLT